MSVESLRRSSHHESPESAARSCPDQTSARSELASHQIQCCFRKAERRSSAEWAYCGRDHQCVPAIARPLTMFSRHPEIEPSCPTMCPELGRTSRTTSTGRLHTGTELDSTWDGGEVSHPHPDIERHQPPRQGLSICRSPVLRPRCPHRDASPRFRQTMPPRDRPVFPQLLKHDTLEMALLCR